jgi:hypothetical protein
MALRSNLNLGIRHVLPVYPFLFVMVGVAAAAALARWRRITIAGTIVLAAGLVVETAAAFPNYIAFFNAVARAHSLKLLSDSNLDWGQDLPLLAKWRRENPTERLYLFYFGSVDPAFYGIDDYVNLPPGFWLGPEYRLVDESRPSVIAISATYVQDNHMPPALRGYYASLRQARPREILGGSIYLYDFPLSSQESR